MNDDKWILETQHKALLFIASIAVKSFLMAMISSYIFCKSIDPNILFLHCSMNIVYVGITIGALILDAQPRNMLKGHLMTQNWLLQLMRDDMTMICHHHELLLRM